MAPPTWSVLVYFVIIHKVDLLPVVALGAISAASGRHLLAIATRKFGKYLPSRIQENLTDAGSIFERSQKTRVGVIALFILSPLPSAQLFEAAGLMKMNLQRLTLAFFSGRILTYAFYASVAKSLESTELGDIFRQAFTSTYGWILQIISLTLIVALSRINWKKYL